MPVERLCLKPVKLIKNARSNRATFSNGAAAVDAKGWQVRGSRYRRSSAPQSSVYSEETVCVVRTRCPFAEELQTDDGFVFCGYTYSVQEVHVVEPPRGIRTTEFEISLK